MERMILWGLLLAGLLASAGCGKEDRKGEQAPPAAPAAADTRSVPAVKDVAAEVKVEATGKNDRTDRRFTLTYTAGANGSVDGESPQVVTPGGTGKTVTAVPAAGYRFAGWSDGVATAGRTDGNVAANLAVTANFAVAQYQLDYAAEEHGSLTGGARQTVPHGGSGRPVSAVPAPGHHFTAWSDGMSANPRTDAEVRADLTVTARFAVNQYTLTYSAGENGSIAGASPQTVSHGGDGTLVTAIPAAGHHFVNWSDGVATPDRIDTKVAGDMNVRADFEPDTHTVGGKVAGLAAGNAVLLKNGGEELAVSANGDFVFSAKLAVGSPYAVTVATQPTSPNQTCTVTGGAGTIAGTDVADLQVECVTNLYKVGGKMSGLPEGSQVVLRNNQGDDLTVSANGKFTFPKALEDGSPYAVAIHSRQLKQKWFCSLEKAVGTLAGGDITGVDIACFPEAELIAVPDRGRIELSWNSKDFRNVTFNLCRARQDIDPVGFGGCQELAGGVVEAKVKSPHNLSRLVINVPYWFQLEVRHPGNRRTYSQVVTATLFGGLNDTGIDWCADHGNRNQTGTGAEKSAGCQAVAATYPGQDALRGRDAEAGLRQLVKSGGGAAGFDFIKVCGNGKLAGEGDCPPNPTLGDAATNWACTYDHVTGLVWEVKTGKGLRGKGNLYSWYNPEAAVNGGAPGVRNGGRCEGGGCDTLAYAREVNQQGLCGAKDWRVPSRKELLSIVANGRYKPAIDIDYFPNTPDAHFWSSSPYADQANLAWQVYFQYGEALTAEKNQGGQVMLVRSQQ